MIKEKLKFIKEELKVCNKDVFCYMDSKIDKLRDEITKLDLFEDTFGFEEEEAI